MNTVFKALAISALFATNLTNAFADLSCPQFEPFPFSKIETRIERDAEEGHILGKNIDCKKIGLAGAMINDIRRLLAPELSAPKQLIFRMVDTFDNAYFDPSEISLNVPYQMVIAGYGKHPVHTLPIWAHEYGHAILGHNLRTILPIWRKSVDTPVSREYADPEYIIDRLLDSYHEFFADVVAVLYSGKGDSIARSLYLTGFIANPEGKPSVCPATEIELCIPRHASEKMRTDLVTQRDFTNRANQLGRWPGSRTWDVHNLLAPARYHIWKYYLSNPAYHGMQGKLAGITVDAIIGDMSRRITRMKDPHGDVSLLSQAQEMKDIQRVNREFITTLDAYFAKGLR